MQRMQTFARRRTFCSLMLEFLQSLFGNGLKDVVRCVCTFANFFDEASHTPQDAKKPAILVELRV